MKTGERTSPVAVSRGKFWLIGVSLFALVGLHSQPAEANIKHHVIKTHHIYHPAHHYTATKRVVHETSHKLAFTASHRYSHTRYASASRRTKLRFAHYYGRHNEIRYASAQYRYSTLQCVPYAREVSHIDLSGDAFLWWAEASGRYARGATPAEGAVLNFRSVRRMPLGHVAVVTSVIDNRTILVTQANWIPGTITNDVTVQDVSPNNDWSEVQVELGDGSKMGAAYPTYGFIYNQPDNGLTIAGNNPAQANEVAEAPTPTLAATGAPDRNLQ